VHNGACVCVEKSNLRRKIEYSPLCGICIRECQRPTKEVVRGIPSAGGTRSLHVLPSVWTSFEILRDASRCSSDRALARIHETSHRHREGIRPHDCASTSKLSRYEKRRGLQNGKHWVTTVPSHRFVHSALHERWKTGGVHSQVIGSVHTSTQTHTYTVA